MCFFHTPDRRQFDVNAFEENTSAFGDQVLSKDDAAVLEGVSGYISAFIEYDENLPDYIALFPKESVSVESAIRNAEYITIEKDDPPYEGREAGALRFDKVGLWSVSITVSATCDDEYVELVPILYRPDGSAYTFPGDRKAPVTSSDPVDENISFVSFSGIVPVSQAGSFLTFRASSYSEFITSVNGNVSAFCVTG